ncbi:MAG: 4-hydroxy-3-methylbut-2-enyl diphosphate reductase [Piscirickettsiaceae bacterium]|nr:4-hydroxy-3-methylbut-2-enyl diphosphate reductase [Piscirickettsiaceae bacterium]
MKLVLANPRGFCAGVDSAIGIVERAIELFGAPIYVRHELVHNHFVVDELWKRGVIFIEKLSEVPDSSTLIFSAHGVSKKVHEESRQRNLRVFDATCPLVTKVHMEVNGYERKGQECILVGHHGHPEVEGTMGQYTAKKGGMYIVETSEDVFKLRVKNSNNLAFVTQTTLSIDDASVVINALKERFPNIDGPRNDDICYATQNRQNAVKNLSQQCDLILVVGSINSSNSNRLCELANRLNTLAYLIDDASDIDPEWLDGKRVIGLTAGASAPESLVQQVVTHLKTLGVVQVDENQGMCEKVRFPLPQELKNAITNVSG